MKLSLRVSAYAALAISSVCSPAVWAQGPTLTLPTTVTEFVVTQNIDPAAASFLTVQLSNITGTFSVSNGTYLGWCIDDPASNVFGSPHPSPLLSSYDTQASTIYPLVPWKKINYIINHKQGGWQDVQRAIWETINSANAGELPSTTASAAMVSAANASGASYVPGPGNVVAVIVNLDGPSVAGGIQDYIIEVPLPSSGGSQVPPPSLSCGTVNTTSGTVGTPFSAQLAVSGGTAPYTYALVSGSLPTKLTLGATTGTISGTPTQSGSFPFTVKVTDSTNLTATSGTCTIVINAQASGCSGYTTYTQGGWGAAPHGYNAAEILKYYFSTVFPSGSVTIGSGSKTLTFTSQTAIQNFLPASGTAGVLTASATNPTSSSAGVFAGQLLAAVLNEAFSAKGITRGGLSALKVKSGILAGYTVEQVIALSNQVMAGVYTGMPAGLTVSGLSDILNSINSDFDNGTQNLGFLQ